MLVLLSYSSREDAFLGQNFPQKTNPNSVNHNCKNMSNYRDTMVQ